MNISLLQHGFAQPLALKLFFVLPVLSVVGVLAQRRRRRLMARLGHWPALDGLVAQRRRGPWLRPLCQTAGLMALIMGIAGPQWGPDEEQSFAPGRDVVVLLDMSRSMLAQDVLGQSAPNRLGRAKDALRDLADTVERHGGHRLALVVFAARAKVVCPLTHDDDHFRDTLIRLDADELLPEIGTVADSVSGTRMGVGLLEAVGAHDPRYRGHQDILMISDGDDPVPDEEWRRGVAAARQEAIPIHTVGVGDPDNSSPIPAAGAGPLQYQGQPVLTRLEEKPLEEIARLTGGIYVPARTKALPLGELFQERIEPLAGHEDVEDALPAVKQRYPWFFGAALGFLSLTMLPGDRRQRAVRRSDSQREVVVVGGR